MFLLWRLNEKNVSSIVRCSFIFWFSSIADDRVTLCSDPSHIKEYNFIKSSGLHKHSDSAPHPHGWSPSTCPSGCSSSDSFGGSSNPLILMASAAIARATAPIGPSRFVISKEHVPGQSCCSPLVSDPLPPISLLSMSLGSGFGPQVDTLVPSLPCVTCASLPARRCSRQPRSGSFGGHAGPCNNPYVAIFH